MNRIFKRYSLIGYKILKKKDLSILDKIKFFIEDQLLSNNFFNQLKSNLKLKFLRI